MSKLRNGNMTQVGGGRSQAIGTGTAAPEGGNDLGSLVAGKRKVHGKNEGSQVGGQPSAPFKFRMAATGAGKP